MKIFLSILLCLNLLFGLDLLLLSEYKDQNVSGWLLSEKLDGIRAYWDGKNLLSRGGKILHTTSDFTECFPPFALDGELYTKHNDFENIQSIVTDLLPDKDGWSKIKFHVFDLPNASGGLLERLNVLSKFLEISPCKSIKVIKQTPISDINEANIILNKILKDGGEGIVLRNPSTPYEGTRSKNAIKLKAFKDSECKVIKILNGKGRLNGVMGSILCEDLISKKRFKIGSGFSDKQRKNPPKIGSIVTYKFQNLTKNGLPRFPVFLRIRMRL